MPMMLLTRKLTTPDTKPAMTETDISQQPGAEPPQPVDIMTRAYNFCAGPAALPQAVLSEAQKDLVNYKGKGLSVM